MQPPAKEGQGLLTKPKLEEAGRSLQRECSPAHPDLSFWLQSWENGFVVVEAARPVVLGFSSPRTQRLLGPWMLRRSCLWRGRNWLQRRA